MSGKELKPGDKVLVKGEILEVIQRKNDIQFTVSFGELIMQQCTVKPDKIKGVVNEPVTTS